MKEAPVTEEEIKNMMKESLEDGEIEEVEHDIVERAFNLSDRKISSIMTHRREIIFLDINDSKDLLQKKIEDKVYNTYPIIDKNIDNVVGFVHLKDLFRTINRNDFSLKNIVSKVNYIPENVNVYNALEMFKKSRIKSALIIDEFGSVVGIVSLKDIMEALVGEMLEENETGDITMREDGTYIVDGRYSFYDFLAYFDEEDLFGEDTKFNTISGLIINIIEKIPQEGQIIEWENFKFEIMDMDGVRIDKVLTTIYPRNDEIE
jgi:putative hemolysin